MTSRVKASMQGKVVSDFPNNTEELITEPIFEDVLGDLVDSCFREPALMLEDGSGRLLVEDGDGYLEFQEGVAPPPEQFYLYAITGRNTEMYVDLATETTSETGYLGFVSGTFAGSIPNDESAFVGVDNTNNRTVRFYTVSGSTIVHTPVVFPTDEDGAATGLRDAPGGVATPTHVIFVRSATGQEGLTTVPYNLANSPIPGTATNYNTTSTTPSNTVVGRFILDFIAPGQSPYDHLGDRMVVCPDGVNNLGSPYSLIPFTESNGVITFNESGAYNPQSLEWDIETFGWDRVSGHLLTFGNFGNNVYRYNVGNDTVTREGTLTLAGVSPLPAVVRIVNAGNYWLTTRATSWTTIDVWELNGLTLNFVRTITPSTGDTYQSLHMQRIRRDMVFIGGVNGSSSTDAMLLTINQATGEIDKEIIFSDSVLSASDNRWFNIGNNDTGLVLCSTQRLTG